jgi:hypothetical protein
LPILGAGAWAEDVPLSHAAHRLTDCKNRIFNLDGSIAREGEVKEGSVMLQDPVPGHYFKNMGDKVCQTLIVESK